MRFVRVDDEETVGGGGVMRCAKVGGAVGDGRMSWCGYYYLTSDGLVAVDGVVAVYSTLTVAYA